ncbi:hypothetical protein AURDEDRAFT_170779 [Auricularia subglabra TFB-10046 SS5]|uniref:Uncharacterized protein n=1 Tax=Auricularia subglabra (strain TFB-10046 / SS5) TaxID=717982 RepID=J0WY20_AURST|nr:hypothetical protein AURDEDRAFT_170779 [Auricularia subglabra TFB-10046 SS5]
MSRAVALKFDTEDQIDYTQRFQGSQLMLSGIAVLNPTCLPPSDRHLIPCVQATVIYNPSDVLPSGHTLNFTLTPEMGVRFEDGSIRWRFSFPAYAPPKGATCTQQVTITGRATVSPRAACLAAIPAKTTIYYRAFPRGI